MNVTTISWAETAYFSYIAEAPPPPLGEAVRIFDITLMASFEADGFSIEPLSNRACSSEETTLLGLWWPFTQAAALHWTHFSRQVYGLNIPVPMSVRKPPASWTLTEGVCEFIDFLVDRVIEEWISQV